MLWCFCHVKQIRKNKLIYQDKPRLKTALEMLRISMYIEDSLSQVNLHSFHLISLMRALLMCLM